MKRDELDPIQKAALDMAKKKAAEAFIENKVAVLKAIADSAYEAYIAASSATYSLYNLLKPVITNASSAANVAANAEPAHNAEVDVQVSGAEAAASNDA